MERKAQWKVDGSWDKSHWTVAGRQRGMECTDSAKVRVATGKLATQPEVGGAILRVTLVSGDWKDVKEKRRRRKA